MTELETELIGIVKDLRAENAALLEVILRQQHLLAEETPVTINSVTGFGKEPWYIKQQKLTKLFRIHSEKEVEEDAS